jgi:hypothetical protein
MVAKAVTRRVPARKRKGSSRHRESHARDRRTPAGRRAASRHRQPRLDSLREVGIASGVVALECSAASSRARVRRGRSSADVLGLLRSACRRDPLSCPCLLLWPTSLKLVVQRLEQVVVADRRQRFERASSSPWSSYGVIPMATASVRCSFAGKYSLAVCSRDEWLAALVAVRRAPGMGARGAQLHRRYIVTRRVRDCPLPPHRLGRTAPPATPSARYVWSRRCVPSATVACTPECSRETER